MKEVPYGKECEAEDHAHQIDVVTSAVLKSPMHGWKQPQRFTHVGKHDQHNAESPDELHK